MAITQKSFKKIRAVKKAKGQAGEHLGEPPNGYIKDPNDKKKWILDEEAAEVVKRIFALCVAGKGPTRLFLWFGVLL